MLLVRKIVDDLTARVAQLEKDIPAEFQRLNKANQDMMIRISRLEEEKAPTVTARPRNKSSSADPSS